MNRIVKRFIITEDNTSSESEDSLAFSDDEYMHSSSASEQISEHEDNNTNDTKNVSDDSDQIDQELLQKIESFNTFDTTPTSNNVIGWKHEIDKLQTYWYPYIQKYCSDFKGYVWRLAHIWTNYIPVKETSIKYLEIGTLCGANLISVINLYGQHPDSKFECIDPWCDYDDYVEYKCLQSTNFDNFIHNIKTVGETERINYYRDFSHNILPQLKNEDYDLIYVDGNHEPYAVLEDLVLCFRKCKYGGYIVIDDYEFNCTSSTATKIGIDGFLKAYKMKIKIIQIANGQVYLQKI